MERLDAEQVRALARRYAGRGPRYTSYPTAADFGELEPGCYEDRLALARRRADDPWSAYIHIPFCAKRCTFCACSVIATPEHDRVAGPYVDHLIQELELVGKQIGSRRHLAQLHLGGGTPTYLSPALLSRVLEAFSREFVHQEGGEWSIEIDARATTRAHMEVLAEFGFSRISLGVQDLDPEVQRNIGREQDRARIEEVIRSSRELGLGGINLDLIYGLPGQHEAGLRTTLEQVIELAPDRLALYGYAHVPWLPGRSNQRRINASLLPGADERLDMFLSAREQLLAAGYEAIGFDHFALPTDTLAQAARAGQLHRNFMGYTVSAGTDLLGFGVTAIGEVAGALVQNEAKLSRWAERIDAGLLPVARGVVRDKEDELRAELIAELMCRHRVDKQAIAARFRLASFEEHFAPALAELRRGAIPDGLLIEDSESLELSEAGRLFVRNVAMAFDARLRSRQVGDAPRFSATV